MFNYEIENVYNKNMGRNVHANKLGTTDGLTGRTTEQNHNSAIGLISSNKNINTSDYSG